MTIGEKILNLRKARGWSQEELAEHIGVTRQAVSRWESDSAKPDADKIAAMCKLFGVSADYLLDTGMPGSGHVRKEEPVHEGKVDTRRIRRWVLVGTGTAVLFLLRLMASLEPTEVHTMTGWYTGFLGYVIGNDLVWLVWIALGLILIGLWPWVRGWKIWKWIRDLLGW